MSPERETIRTFGERGRTVRVLKDTARNRTLVQWYEAGKLKKKVFPATKPGRIEAEEWASGYSEALERRAAGAVMTVRGIWEAYCEVEFPNLRPRTQELYRERWMKWEDFLGKDSDPEAVETKDIDRFVTRARKLGKSMNQARHVLNVARIVFRWAVSRRHITNHDVPAFRWKTAKDAKPLEIPEHSPEDHRRLLAVLDANSAAYWRIWGLLGITGSQGPRIRTARYLRWADIDEEAGLIVWPAKTMKQGEDFAQPLTAETRRVLEVARRWRYKDGYTGEYVFYAARKGKEPVYTYQSAWIALRKAEKLAGVQHVPYRAFHGFRRMAAGNVYDQLKDPLAAAEWIGDKDAKQMRSYLKRRAERLEAARDATDRR